MRDSKNILHAKLGVSPMERQYGGGLDAAYMNRRRSSAFAAPDATSAFDSPMSKDGLPTIYRANGGDFDFMDSYDQADIDAAMADDPTDDGLGDNVDPGLAQGLIGIAPPTSTSSDDGEMDMRGVATYGYIDPEDPYNTSKDRGPLPGEGLPGASEGFSLNQANLIKEYNRSKEGYPSILNPLFSVYTLEEIARAFAVPGAVANMLSSLQSGKTVGGGIAGTLQDAMDRAGNIRFGPEMLNAINKDKGEKSKDSEKSFSSVLNLAKNFIANTKDFSPENMQQFNKELAEKGARFEPNNAFASVATGLATPLLASMGSKYILNSPKTIGRIVNRDGLSFELKVNSKGEPSVQVDTGPGSPGALRERDPLGSNYEEPKETPETEMAAGVASQVKEKSTLEKALARKKKKKVDPNIQIIMDIYGLTREEANKFLGNEGVGTGGVNEFEGT